MVRRHFCKHVWRRIERVIRPFHVRTTFPLVRRPQTDHRVLCSERTRHTKIGTRCENTLFKTVMCQRRHFLWREHRLKKFRVAPKARVVRHVTSHRRRENVSVFSVRVQIRPTHNIKTRYLIIVGGTHTSRWKNCSTSAPQCGGAGRCDARCRTDESSTTCRVSLRAKCPSCSATTGAHLRRRRGYPRVRLHRRDSHRTCVNVAGGTTG